MPNFVDWRRFDAGPGALAARRGSCPLDGVGAGVSSDLILSSEAALDLPTHPRRTLVRREVSGCHLVRGLGCRRLREKSGEEIG